ncbi:MAG: ABC transporter ATP-binding protein [Longimicrobiales bacterium]|nr:ABC transporter ATP-binding protein [Longimicrobiales bacterium]
MSIEWKEVHKAFGSNEILKGFSLRVEEGETVSVIGGSGEGKSTLLKHAIGLLKPDRGEMWVGDGRIDLLEGEELYEARRQIGYVFQFAALFDSMTVAENVAMGLRRIPGLEEEEIAERVATALQRVDLEGIDDHYPAELSGGMKKRAGLARAIALEPTYLLYDEPTTGLDPVTLSMVDELILRMRDRLGVTSVVITHDMESAYRISDRIAMLHDGRVRDVGTPDEIRESDDPVVRGFIEGRPDLMQEAS